MAGASLGALRGIGPKVVERLAAQDIRELSDLWFFLPRGYEDRTQLTSAAGLRDGIPAQVLLTIQSAERVFRGRQQLLVEAADEHGDRITLRFFHFNEAQRRSFREGARVLVYGAPRVRLLGRDFVHPAYRLLGDHEQVVLGDRLLPVYPELEGAGPGTVRGWVEQALKKLPTGEELELLPAHISRALQLPTLREALLFVHHPPVGTDVHSIKDGLHPAQQRLAFEELLAHHLSLRRQRLSQQSKKAPILNDSRLAEQLLQQLPYQLTSAQQRVLGEISNDLSGDTPMLRLLQGDVGSGKTIVAALSALFAVAKGRQVAVMAPTELLAEQHLRNFSQWLEPMGIKVEWLAGKITGRKREQALQRIANGEAQVVVGTHALMQEGVEFANLALVIVDEQHRFGVHQRLALRDKGSTDQYTAHQLVMTATPIPRTLAMTAYADLDVSSIDELPPGRTPVRTVVLPDTRRDELTQRLIDACAQGRQAYWVCTLIEESDEIEAQAAEAAYAELQKQAPGLRIGLVHGRMKPAEKQAVMQGFKDHQLDVLVATTVIEVGVDVPNASLMVIENAERLGLAQLHQLRGRVGRGSAVSDCVLMFRAPLSAMAKQRLQVMRETNDGFVIARQDLELRGPGEILGTRQTGLAGFRFANLMRDADLLPVVQQVAQQLMADDAPVVDRLLQRWIGSSLRYAQA